MRSPPLFPPSLWSVHDRIELGIPRTQSKIEAWYRRLEILLGSAHVRIFKLISELQKEQKNVEEQIECIIRGESNIKQKKISNGKRESLLFLTIETILIP